VTDLMPGVEHTPLALLLLGRGSDPESERGVECPGDLPAASDPSLVARARATRPGSEAAGRSPGQSTPRSDSGSLPRPSRSRASGVCSTPGMRSVTASPPKMSSYRR
jgi:hypothetical protein